MTVRSFNCSWLKLHFGTTKTVIVMIVHSCWYKLIPSICEIILIKIIIKKGYLQLHNIKGKLLRNVTYIVYTHPGLDFSFVHSFHFQIFEEGTPSAMLIF